MVSFDKRKEYVKWYRLAQQAVNDESVIPKLTDRQIMGLVSDENWLPIASPEIDKSMPPEVVKERVRKSKHPHIRIYLEDPKMEEIDSRTSICVEEPKIGIGLLFNTIASIGKLRNILTPHHTEEKRRFIQLLRGLAEGYETLVYKKTKTTCPADSPDYGEILDPIITSRIDDEFVDRMFRRLEIVRQDGVEELRRRKERGEWYWQGLAVHLAEIEMPKNVREYKKKVGELVEIYKVCTAVKTGAQIRRIKKNEAKEAKLLTERKKTLELLSRMPRYPRHREAAEELREVNRRLSQLEKRERRSGM